MSEREGTASDIVEELREAIGEGAGELAERCIAEIERLRSDLAVFMESNAALTTEVLDLRSTRQGQEREAEQLADGLIDYIRAPYSRSWLVDRIRALKEETSLATINEKA